MFADIFQRREVRTDKLLSYGFRKEEQYMYSTDIMDGSFTLFVRIDENGAVDTALIEKELGDPYVLYKTNASGAFVGEVRSAIKAVLRDVSEKCYVFSAFREKQSLMLIDYVRKTYGDALEFLWEKFPDNAIWRRKDNKKWYAAILTVQKAKLGIRPEKAAEIIDLRIEPEKMADLIDNKKYFPGWHMNKKHWYTIILDGSVSDEELCRRIDTSYRIAKK